MSAPVVTHVGTCVSDLAVSEAFYTKALGFTRLFDLQPPDGITGKLLGIERPVGLSAVYLGSGGFVLELLHFDREGNDPRSERTMTQPGLTHISLFVTDIAATRALVLEHGGTLVDETDIELAILVRDPDSQLIELVQSSQISDLVEANS